VCEEEEGTAPGISMDNAWSTPYADMMVVDGVDDEDRDVESSGMSSDASRLVPVARSPVIMDWLALDAFRRKR
ncbi:MAG: hypothetical protein ABGY24_13880, partial [bacterium]